MDLAAVREGFRVGERDGINVLRGIGRAMVGELLGRLRAGKITQRNLESQRRSAFRGRRKAREVLLDHVATVSAAGIRHVKAELGRLNAEPTAD